MSDGEQSTRLVVPETANLGPLHQVAERCGWAFFLAVIVLALLGLTGMGGPFARAKALASTGSLEFPRVTRWQADDQLHLQLATSDNAEAEVVLNSEFTDLFTIQNVTPSPVRSEVTERGLLLVFARASEASRISFHVRAQHPALAARRQIDVNGAPIVFSTVVLP